MSAARPLSCFISYGAASSDAADRLAELLHGMGVETYGAAPLPGWE